MFLEPDHQLWITAGILLSEEDKELNSYHVLSKTPLMWCSHRRQNAPGPQGPLPADSFGNATQQIRENTLHLNPATARARSQIYAVKEILCTSIVSFTQIFQWMSTPHAPFHLQVLLLVCYHLHFPVQKKKKKSEKWDEAKVICTEMGEDLYNF